MSFVLSLLDKSPVVNREPPAAALARTVALAQRADLLGYHRFWLAEHHGYKVLASSAPEILISYILAQTSRIRVGSGGVMLQHYSPYKVAETFNMLASLAPGRVDLGVGKAPGGFPLSTQALQSGYDPARRGDFSNQLSALDGFLTGAPGAIASPRPSVMPERFLLGASVDSAKLAADLGWNFVFAAQFNGDPGLIERCFETYAQGSGRVPLLAVAAFAAETQALAEQKVAALRVFKMQMPGGASVNLGSADQAVEFARQAGVSEYTLTETKPSVLAGTAAFVRQELEQLHQRFGVQEFILDTPVAGDEERFKSIELLAPEHAPKKAPDNAPAHAAGPASSQEQLIESTTP